MAFMALLHHDPLAPRLRVLLVTDAASTPGSSDFATLAAKTLTGAGHAVWMFILHGDGTATDERLGGAVLVRDPADLIATVRANRIGFVLFDDCGQEWAAPLRIERCAVLYLSRRPVAWNVPRARQSITAFLAPPSLAWSFAADETVYSTRALFDLWAHPYRSRGTRPPYTVGHPTGDGGAAEGVARLALAVPVRTVELNGAPHPDLDALVIADPCGQAEPQRFIDAMASGILCAGRGFGEIPVMLARVGVASRPEGTSLSAHEVEVLADGLAGLLEDPADWHAATRIARDRAWEWYSPASWLIHFEAVVQAVAGVRAG